MNGRELLCTVNDELSEKGCNKRGLQVFQFVALLALIAGSYVLFLTHRRYSNADKPSQLTPKDIGLSFWSNLSVVSVIAMVVWQCAPWVGFLTVGRVPEVFVHVPWQWFAIGNLLLLLYAFWRAESCNWHYEVKHKKNMSHLHATWTQRDTLWMCVFIYLVALGLSYVSYDVLTNGGTRPMIRG
jgi:hypothetical protein